MPLSPFLVFGAQWTLAGSFAGVVAPWYLAQFVVSPISRVVAVFSGQKTKLIWDAALRGFAGGGLLPGTLQSVASFADGSTIDTCEYGPLPGLLPVAAADDPAGERIFLRIITCSA